MNRRVRLVVTGFVAAGCAISSRAASQNGTPKDPEFAWSDRVALTQRPAKTVGILLINYKRYPVSPARMSEEYARSNHDEWLQEKPEVLEDPLGKIVSAAVTKDLKSISAPPLRITEAVSLELGRSVKDGLGKMAAADVILIVAAGNPRPGVISWTAGGESAYANADIDSVLCTRDGKILATYRTKIMATMPTIGQVDKGYDSARPFEQQVSFRYRIEDFVNALTPQVRGTVEKPFLAALRSH